MPWGGLETPLLSVSWCRHAKFLQSQYQTLTKRSSLQVLSISLKFFRRFTTLPVWLPLLIYLLRLHFPANGFCTQNLGYKVQSRFLELNLSVQRRWWQPHGCQIARGTAREAASPELTLSAGDQPARNFALKQTPPSLATHPSGKMSQTSQRNLSVLSETFVGCNFIPAVLGLTSSAVCFLKGCDGLWYGAHLVPGFWLWTVSIQGSSQCTNVPNPPDSEPNPGSAEER